MLRFIGLLALSYLVWLGLEGLLEQVSPKPTPEPESPDPAPASVSNRMPETLLVACRRCGIHIPVNQVSDGCCGGCRPTPLEPPSRS